MSEHLRKIVKRIRDGFDFNLSAEKPWRGFRAPLGSFKLWDTGMVSWSVSCVVSYFHSPATQDRPSLMSVMVLRLFYFKWVAGKRNRADKTFRYSIVRNW